MSSGSSSKTKSKKSDEQQQYNRNLINEQLQSLNKNGYVVIDKAFAGKQCNFPKNLPTEGGQSGGEPEYENLGDGREQYRVDLKFSHLKQSGAAMSLALAYFKEVRSDLRTSNINEDNLETLVHPGARMLSAYPGKYKHYRNIKPLKLFTTLLEW